MKSILSLALTLALQTGAAYAAPDLEERAGREAGWSSTTVNLPGVTGSTKFVVTDTGALRLNEMGQSYEAELKVKASEGVFKTVRNGSHVARACGNLRGILEFELREKHKLGLEMLVNPINKSVLNDGIADTSGWRTRYTPIETSVQSMRVEPVLSFVNNAVPLTSVNRLKAAQEELSRQFRAQQDEINAKGVFGGELTAADDIACDILMGQVRFDARLVISFDAALLRRQEVISGREIQNLQEALKAMPVSEGPLMTKLISRSANLGVILNRQLSTNYQAFMQNKFAKFHDAVINTNDASVVNLSIGEATKFARKLDDLSTALDTNQSLILSKPGWTY